MTTTEVSRAGQKLLGMYFLVYGLMALPNTLGVFGIEFPPGSSRVGAVSASAVQGVIGIVAGLVLMRTKIESDRTTESIESLEWERSLLQLLGLYFLITGAWALARPAVAMFFYSTAWQTRVSDFVAALVAVAAGLILIMRPKQMANALKRFRNN